MNLLSATFLSEVIKMKMKIFLLLAICLCACTADVKEKETAAEPEQNKDKRQTQDDFVPSHLIYRTSRKQEQVAPVEEQQDDDRDPLSHSNTDKYRPGQVFSLNAHELLELQQERKAPLASNQQLQQLYNNPQQDHRQNLQQVYYLEPQGGRQQVSLQPSHAVIARPHYSLNGGEASVGAALSVSDSGVSQSDTYDQELLALLGQSPVRQEDLRQQPYQSQQVQASTQSIAPQYQQVSTQSAAPQYQQVDRYITKPSKKPTKQRTKVHSHISPPQSSAAPQQYLIETTNVQQQPQQVQVQPQYRPAPQPQRAPQALRYVPVPSIQTYVQQALYGRPESQGLKVVAPPKLEQQPRPQLSYRLVQQYQPQEATPKQYRIVEAPRPQPIRQEQRIPASSIERPVTYLKRFPEAEKMRSVKIYDPAPQEALAPQQPAQIIGEQYYLRPIYTTNEQQRGRYELTPLGIRTVEQPRVLDTTKPPHSAIYVSKNIAPKKLARPQSVRLEQAVNQQQLIREQSERIEQPSNVERVNIEQHGQSIEEQRSQLPPPRNNRAYTPEEFAALVAAGYAVTPIPVAPLGHQVAQSRSSEEQAPAQPHRRPLYSRRHQYLPLRGDEAP